MGKIITAIYLALLGIFMASFYLDMKKNDDNNSIIKNWINIALSVSVVIFLIIVI